MTGDNESHWSDSASHEHEADRRFLDALLYHHFQGDGAAESDRITAALDKIDHGVESTDAPAAASRWFQALRRVAAALALAILLVIPALLTDSATAAIERAQIVMARLADRHYQIEIETPVGLTVPGDIWFRGAESMVMRFDTPAGEIWAGEGLETAWIVPPMTSAPVRIIEKGSLREALTLQENVKTPLLQLTTMLDQLGDSYAIGYGPDGETIEARRLAGARADLPAWVNVRIGTDGVVRELRLEWPTVLGLSECTLTWQDGVDMPNSFYEHIAHHDRDREVQDLR